MGFAVLIISRVVAVVLLAMSNPGTLHLNPGLAYLLCIALLIPALYLFYSVFNYFGIDRAFGIDHFEPVQMSTQPLEKRGIFKYSNNAMYVFGFLLLWIPGLVAMSKAAVLVALFNHLYIWVHYYCTELPDMKSIYGS